MCSSAESCRVDLIKWGAKWDKNTNRPYFIGHEADENVLKRQEFVQYLIDRKDVYYYPEYRENGLNWVIPFRKPVVLMCHDESTFRSGEIQLYRYFFPSVAPLFNKGKD